MIKLFASSLITVIMSVHFCYAQSRPNEIVENEALIIETIEMYFDGWLTGDTLKLGRAMHTTCKLKNIKDEEVLVFDRAKYLSFFSRDQN